MRLIDADALKESLTETLRRCDEWIENAKDGETRTIAESNYTAFLESILRVKEAPTIDAVPRWIPCEEKLPDDGEDVLISYRYKVGEGDTSHVYIALTSYGRIWSDSIFGDRKDWRQPFQFFYSNYEVIAWMPLPEPYVGERKDDD